MNQILLLLKFTMDKDIELFNTKRYFNENIEYIDFKDEIEQLLDEKNASFKLDRITVFDNDFMEFIDLENNFIFQSNQKFKIMCKVSLKISFS